MQNGGSCVKLLSNGSASQDVKGKPDVWNSLAFLDEFGDHGQRDVASSGLMSVSILHTEVTGQFATFAGGLIIANNADELKVISINKH